MGTLDEWARTDELKMLDEWHNWWARNGWSEDGAIVKAAWEGFKGGWERRQKTLHTPTVESDEELVLKDNQQRTLDCGCVVDDHQTLMKCFEHQVIGH